MNVTPTQCAGGVGDRSDGSSVPLRSAVQNGRGLRSLCRTGSKLHPLHSPPLYFFRFFFNKNIYIFVMALAFLFVWESTSLRGMCFRRATSSATAMAIVGSLLVFVPLRCFGMKYGASVSKSRQLSVISLAVFRAFQLSGHVIIGVNTTYELEKRCNHLFATTHSSDMKWKWTFHSLGKNRCSTVKRSSSASLQ